MLPKRIPHPTRNGNPLMESGTGVDANDDHGVVVASRPEDRLAGTDQYCIAGIRDRQGPESIGGVRPKAYRAFGKYENFRLRRLSRLLELFLNGKIGEVVRFPWPVDPGSRNVESSRSISLSKTPLSSCSPTCLTNTPTYVSSASAPKPVASRPPPDSSSVASSSASSLR